MSNCALPKMNTALNPLLVAAGLMALAVPSLAQAVTAPTPPSSLPADAPYAATMTFDIASIRENKNLDMNAGFMMSAQFAGHSTTYRATNWPIENLLSSAYGVDRYQIVGLPNWPWPTFFMIEAKGDSEADAKMAALTVKQQSAEQQHMLQVLLEDRFKLKTHWETKEGDVFNLVVARGGPKLGAEGSIPPSADELKMFGNHPVPEFFQKNDGRGYDFVAHGAPISRLLEILPAAFGGPVIDKTGLTGKYDFVLKYNRNRERDRPADDLDPTPPMDRALQEELGLKLEAAKGPVKVLVIDHIEKPSEN